MNPNLFDILIKSFSATTVFQVVDIYEEFEVLYDKA